jgi:hypothetical protein
MAVPLNGGDEPVTIHERVRLRAPGMTGTVEVQSIVDSLSALEAVEVGHGRLGGGDGGARYLEWVHANASLSAQASFAIASTSAPRVDFEPMPGLRWALRSTRRRFPQRASPLR